MHTHGQSSFRKSCLAALLGAAGLGWGLPENVNAEFLFNSFLVPSFSTRYSAWDVFYTPYGNLNYPDYAAPYGTRGTAPAGYTIPSNANPTNPTAYWDTRNATITQIGTSSAFIISPGVSNGGNIYSFAAATGYALSSGVAATTNLIAFQFQTDGVLLDFSTIRLQYTDGSGTVVTLPPDDLLREYRTSGSSFGGVTNRSATQWNLTGRNVTSYQVLFNAPSSSNSFQLAVLDTAATFGDIIPPIRFWNAIGAGNWGSGANWQQGSTSNENGNVRFINAADTTPLLDANHTVGELRFNTAANVTINTSGGYALTVNTGITAPAAATGIYTVNTAYKLGAFNIFDLAASDVRITGVVSGNYGFEKDGVGKLTLGGNNTFTGAVAVGGGTLTLSGNNVYTSSTQIAAGGKLVIAAGGALAATPVTLASGATLTNNGVVNGSVDASGLLDGTGTFNGSMTYESTAALASGCIFNGGLNVKQGATMALASGTVVARGAIIIDGTVRFTSGATLDLSGATSIVNNGTLDCLSGNLILPTGVTVTNGQNGRVLTRDLLQIHNTISKSGTTITIQCDGYSAHVYKLQKAATLNGGGFSNVAGVASQNGVTQANLTPTPLVFTDTSASGQMGFYRVVVDQ